MSGNDPTWRRMPILRALFEKWRSARGNATPGSFRKPFRRDWEELLEDAGLTTGEARREADQDARTLEKAGLIELKLVKYRPYQIEAIVLPLSSESRIRSLFADELPAQNEEHINLTSVEWHPALAFVSSARTGVAAADLLKLNAFLLQQPDERRSVPIKERSLEIFGDEKRLDALRNTRLFDEGRLSLESLRCFTVTEPLGWSRGPRSNGPVIVIENAATWDSYCRWNTDQGHFSAVVYGGGNRFMDSVVRLQDIFAEIGGTRPVLYFGDLDLHGLRIPQIASKRAIQAGLPEVQPDLWSYELLLKVGRMQDSSPADGDEKLDASLFAWLNHLSQPGKEIVGAGNRIPQEWLGWNVLSSEARNEAVAAP